MANLRTFKSIVNAVYRVIFQVDQASISQTDRELIAKFGEPEIAVGGTFFGGATATATVSSGVVTAITISNGGNNWPSVPTVVFTPTNGGANAAATAVLTNGVITAINISNGGSGYTGAPTISFTPTPSNTFTIPDEYLKIFSGLPYTKNFDSLTSPFNTNTEAKVTGYKSTIQQRFAAALTTLRANGETFTGEEITQV